MTDNTAATNRSLGIDVNLPRPDGTRIVRVRIGGDPLMSHAFDVHDEHARSAFLKRLSEEFPGIDEDTRAALGERIVTKALAQDHTAHPPPGPEHSTQGDAWPDPVPFESPAPPPFPTHCLPPEVRDLAEVLSRAHDCPPDGVAMAALTVLGLPLCGRVVACGKPGHREPPVLWSCLVSDPGTRKSAAFKDIEESLRAIERERREGHQERVDRSRSRKAILERRVDAAEKALGTGDDKSQQQKLDEALRDLREHVVYHEPEFTASDCTVEVLAHVLQRQGGRVALLSAESEILSIAAGCYAKGQGAGNLAPLLKSYDGERLEVERVGRGPGRIVVDRALMPLAVCAQPVVLDEIRAQRSLRGRGLLARVAWLVPASRTGSRSYETSVSEEELAAAKRGFEMLLRSLFASESQAQPGSLTEIAITPEALSRLSAFFAETETEQLLGGRFETIKDAASKSHGRCLRIALVLHAASRPVNLSDPITGSVMRQAVEIASYLNEHALLAFEGSTERPEHLRARRLWARIQAKRKEGKFERGLSAATLYSDHVQRWYGDTAEITPDLEELVRRGYLRRAPWWDTPRQKFPTFEVRQIVRTSEQADAGLTICQPDAGQGPEL